MEHIGSPAELPAEMNGLKSQQFRWMKGGAETAKKILPKIWRSKVSILKKMHASAHLLNSSIFLCVFIVGVLSVPLSFFLGYLGFNSRNFSIFLLGFAAIIFVYYVANVNTTWKDEPFFKTLFKFLILFPIFLALSMGLSLHNSFAVIQGYIGRKSAFVRTPKFNIKGLQDTLSKKKYLNRKIPFTTVLEGLLALYFIYAIYFSFKMEDLSFIFLHILLAIGYGTVCLLSLMHWRLK